VEDRRAYKHCDCDVHTKVVSITRTAGEFNKEICQTVEQAIGHHYAAKSEPSCLKILQETILLPYLPFQIIAVFLQHKMPYKGSTDK
jgi:hypothetical protein